MFIAAGDPIEAEAIHSAFFGESNADDGELLVGSIKTVCGHTEGTAGVAGILKASLALQKGAIPPNMLFTTLNPSIKPFVNHLHLATNRSAWPLVSNGQPRRASVNRWALPMVDYRLRLTFFSQLWFWWDKCARHSRVL